jgi:hypothetical protein
VQTALGTTTKKEYDRMLRKRNVMRSTFDLLAKFILNRPIWFGDTSQPGTMPKLSLKGVSDDTAIDASRTAATAFGGALWPNASESFEVTLHPSLGFNADMELVLQSEEVKYYLAEVTRRGRQPYDAPEAMFLISWGEHLDSQIVMGTSGILGVEDRYDSINPIRFRSITVETSVIDEGPNGDIDTICFESALTIRQACEKYGAENMSKTVQDLYKDDANCDSYIKIIQLVKPRTAVPVGADRNEKQYKPYASIHMEVATDHVILNDGMDEKSGFVVRFRKFPAELYGRSLAMDALATVKETNVLRAGMTKALQLQLGPPIGFDQEQLGGAGSINLSPDAQVPIYRNSSIPQSRPPVEILLNVPEPRVANERMTNLEEKILTKFLIDRLLDFSNKTRMTLGEAQMRTDFRNQALGNLFARQMSELLYPLIKWSLGVQLRRKMLGLHPQDDAIEIALRQFKGERPLIMPQVVADAISRGLFPFAIRFISPAARAMKADALIGLEKLVNFTTALAVGGMPNAVDNIDEDKAVELYQDHVGAPVAALRAKDKREQARKARQEMQAQMAQLQQQEQGSQIAKNSAKAAKDFAQAGVNPQGALSA